MVGRPGNEARLDQLPSPTWTRWFVVSPHEDHSVLWWGGLEPSPRFCHSALTKKFGSWDFVSRYWAKLLQSLTCRIHFEIGGWSWIPSPQARGVLCDLVITLCAGCVPTNTLYLRLWTSHKAKLRSDTERGLVVMPTWWHLAQLHHCTGLAPNWYMRSRRCLLICKFHSPLLFLPPLRLHSDRGHWEWSACQEWTLCTAWRCHQVPLSAVAMSQRWVVSYQFCN